MEANGRPEIEDAIRDDDKHEALAVENRGLRGSCGKKAEAKRARESRGPQLTRLAAVDYFRCLSYEACEVGTSPSPGPPFGEGQCAAPSRCNHGVARKEPVASPPATTTPGPNMARSFLLG